MHYAKLTRSSSLGQGRLRLSYAKNQSYTLVQGRVLLRGSENFMVIESRIEADCIWLSARSRALSGQRSLPNRS